MRTEVKLFGLLAAAIIVILSSTAIAQPSAYTINGNSVYIDDARAFINVTPHTLTGDGWVEINFRSKNYDGDADIVFGFDKDTATPRSPQYYNPHYENVTQSYSCSGDDKFFDYTTDPRHFWCYLNTSYWINGNTTLVLDSELLYDHYWEWANAPERVAYWNESVLVEWSKLPQIWDTENIEWQGFDRWKYVEGWNIDPDVDYRLRVWMDVDFNSDGKYWFGIKPSGETVSQAIAADHFYYIDPWWNETFDKYQPLSIWADSGSASDHIFPINITYDSDMQADFDDIRFLSADESVELDYWLHEKQDSAWAVFYIEMVDVINTTNTTVYMYYDNSYVDSNSDIQNTFWFADDFNDNSVNTTKWTNSASGTEENQIFNFTSNTWSFLNATSYPIERGTEFIIELSWLIYSDYYFSFTVHTGQDSLDHSVTLQYRTDQQDFNFKYGNNYECQMGGAITTGIWYNTTVFIETMSNISVDIPNYGAYYGCDLSAYAGEAGNALQIYSTDQTIDSIIDNYRVRDYFEPAVHVYFGAEVPFTVTNNAPNVDIILPTAITYFSNQVTLNYSVWDVESSYIYTTLWVDGTPDGSQNLTNNSFYLTTKDVTEGSIEYIVQAQDLDGADPLETNDTVTFSVIYTNLTSETYQTVNFETNVTRNFLQLDAVSAVVDSVNAWFIYNGEYSTASVSSGGTGIYTNYTIEGSHFIDPEPVNASTYDFYFVYQVNYDNGTSLNFTTTNQTLTIWQSYYIDSTTLSPTDFIEGSDISYYVTIGNIIDNATITVNVTFNNTNYTTSEYLTNIYKATITTPDIGSYNQSFNLTPHLIVTNEETRSATGSNESVTVYQITLTNCSADTISQTEAIRYFFKSELNSTAITGSLDQYYDVWYGGNIHRGYGYSRGTNQSYAICIYPTWASYTTDAILFYEAAGYSSRYYYHDDYTLNNITNEVSLYLLPDDTGSLVTITVEDADGFRQPNVTIQIHKYDIGTNTYILATVEKTNLDGQTATYLELYDVLYKFILLVNGTVRNVYDNYKVTATEITLKLAEEDRIEWFNYQNRTSGNCYLTASNTTFVCDVVDTSGLLASTTLTVDLYGAAGIENNCTSTSTSSTATHSCYLGNTSGKLYRYNLKAQYEDTTYLLASGWLDFTQSNQYGTYGLFAAILLLMTLTPLGIRYPEIAILMNISAIIISYMIGILVIGWSGVMSIVLIAGIILYKMRG